MTLQLSSNMYERWIVVSMLFFMAVFVFEPLSSRSPPRPPGPKPPRRSTVRFAIRPARS